MTAHMQSTQFKMSLGKSTKIEPSLMFKQLPLFQGLSKSRRDLKKQDSFAMTDC